MHMYTGGNICGSPDPPTASGCKARCVKGNPKTRDQSMHCRFLPIEDIYGRAIYYGIMYV